MKKNILILSILSCLLTMNLQAQLAMGKWRTHFAYNSVAQIAQTENKVFAISEGALFSVDKLDGGMEFYSKTSGLNGTDIKGIEYDSSTQQLLIAYSNGNIDLLSNGGISNIADLYNKQMSASKLINQIQFYQKKAYLSCDFGIIVLDMQKKEVIDTYYIGPNASNIKVLNTTIHNGIIYALSTETIFKASINDPFLVNYEFWSTVNNFPGSGGFQGITSYGENLILLRANKLYKMDSGNNWSAFLPTVTVSSFNVSNGSLNILTNNGVYLLDSSLNAKLVSDLGNITDTEYDSANNTYWFAANGSGIISYTQASTETPTISYYKPTGPAVNIPWSMTFSGQKLFVVPGGRWGAQYQRPGNLMIYENGKWTNIYSNTIQEQTGSPVLDFMNVAVDPIDPKHFFVTSYGTGLYEFKNDLFFKWHNYTNSTIQGHPAVPLDPNNYSRLDGAVFDSNGNLFFSNCAVNYSVKVYKADQTWTQLKYTDAVQETLGAILINKNKPNQKWILSVRNNNIGILDDNGTISETSDDKSTTITGFKYTELDKFNNLYYVTANPRAIFSIAQDNNGVIWVGTDIGPFLYSDFSKVFEPDYTCTRVKIPRNDSTNLADYLLVDEKITSIAIDGANRKWLGTEGSGVYLMSEDGKTTINHFTTSNSPLLSNIILSIAINPVTGEVFFGTGQGIVSYQGDAANANETFSNVRAYPNPVRENYNGIITISGLVTDTQVKITDLNGNLICQTVSNGSLATWDGKDVYGKKVSTGIYLAICVNSDGTQSTITKILIIN